MTIQRSNGADREEGSVGNTGRIRIDPLHRHRVGLALLSSSAMGGALPRRFSTNRLAYWHHCGHDPWGLPILVALNFQAIRSLSCTTIPLPSGSVVSVNAWFRQLTRSCRRDGCGRARATENLFH